ncbi:MAG: ABC transporter permease [Thermoleophilia bacterium]|nr:ABC transporter permease [Thermoleophilia bacterium]
MNVYADVFRYRDLFVSLFRREFQARYKGSVLGVVWSLFNPLLLLAVYLLVFSLLWRITGSIEHYPLYLVVGISAWVFLSISLQGASRSLIEHANLIRKTRFPRQLVPLSVVATQVVTFGIMLVVVTALSVALVPEARTTWPLAVPLALLFVGLVAGLAVLVAVLNVVLRDIEHLVGALLLPWFFLTPVLYSFDQLPGFDRHHGLVQVLRYGNPVTPGIEALRAPLWAGDVPAAGDVLHLAAVAATALALGAWVFTRLDDRIAVDL